MSPQGGPVSPGASEHRNVAAYLPELAARHPEALAVAVAAGRDRTGRARYATLSALELDRRSDRVAHALVAIGIGEGARAVLMVKPSPDLFVLTFAMLKVGAIPVMVDPGLGLGHLGRCLAEAEPHAFIGIPRAHLARALLGWAPTARIRLTVGGRVGLGGPSLADLERAAPPEPFRVLDPDPEQMAAILFTSGSTGPPKGVITPYRVFAAQVRLLREAFGIEPGERDLSTFPLFALFGPALGMASIVPAMDASRPARADPERLLEAIRDFRCTNMFASPALIDRLGRFCAARGVGLPTLRRAISAGAPASMAALERFAAALPDSAEVLTPYGATEALPVSVIGTAEILGDTRPHTQRGAGVCVGRPVPSAEVRIVPIRDDAMPDFSETAALPCGQIGEIAVAGPMVTPGYYGRPEATALAKMHDTQGRLWHRMGDVGYLDEKGRLWMCGRKSHRVETATETLFSVPCEAVFDAHPAVFRSALVGVRRGDATIPVLCVEREPGQPRSKAVLSAELLELARRHGHTRQIERVLYSRRFPVDVRHNAKIFREKLAVWAQGRIG